MIPRSIACGFGLVLPAYAQFTIKPCLTTVTLPFITVSDTHDGFENTYTRTYKEFYSQGLREKTYTITQTCSDIDCQPPPIETAPPPGFTQAVVECSSCGGTGLQAATLTFPTESIQAYSSSGYVVVPISFARPTQALVDQNGDQSYQNPSNDDSSSPSAVALAGTNQENGSTHYNGGSHSGGSSDQPDSESGVLGGLDVQYKHQDHVGSDSSDSQQAGGSEQQQGDEGSSGNASKQPGSNNGSSAQGDGSSDEQAAGSLGGTGSNEQWNSTETASGPEPVSETSTHGENLGGSSSSNQSDVYDSPDGASNPPGASNDTSSSSSYQYEAAPSDSVSAEGGHFDTNSDHQTDTHSSGNSSGASDDTFDPAGGDASGSSGDNTHGTSGNDSSSSQDHSSSKQKVAPEDSNNDADSPDVPPIVSSANSTKTNIFACIMAIMASIFITGLV
ncbi:hypothetical protein NW762_013632 [Fusarium torreyae]|uniref:Uncharacterized protein n=1 Tax=Fusarium torreyae TaxID=1237075 RepID=A0A9W8VA51_9HYPO|nr:hypothetical protein NW762_013632 [Fusarium torreyae]